jgi:glycerol uptake facilitator protein
MRNKSFLSTEETRLPAPWFGEFMGTLVLVLLGDGVVAGVLLKKSKAEDSGWIVITAGWAFAVMCGVFTAIACGSSEAHLNPAVTLGMAVRTGNFSRFLPFFVAQVLGGTVGATLVWLHYAPHWKETTGAAAKLAVFSTGPAIRNYPANFLSEVIATFVLVFVVSAIFSKGVAATGPAAGLGPFLVASLVWGIGLSLGGTTGYAINPARDLGPRIAHTILPIAGKGGSDWSYAPIPVIGPLVGGALAGLLVRLLPSSRSPNAAVCHSEGGSVPEESAFSFLASNLCNVTCTTRLSSPLAVG